MALFKKRILWVQVCLMGSASKLTCSAPSEAQHAGTSRSKVAHSFLFDLGFVIYTSLKIISLRKRQLVALL